MLYMFLICNDPTVPLEPSDPPNLQPKHAELEQDLREKGTYVSGAALYPYPGPTTLRVKNGKAMRTDGPFAETKEAIGGYYIIDCEDEADAIANAARIPVSPNSWIQVRPIILWHPK